MNKYGLYIQCPEGMLEEYIELKRKEKEENDKIINGHNLTDDEFDESSRVYDRIKEIEPVFYCGVEMALRSFLWNMIDGKIKSSGEFVLSFTEDVKEYIKSV